MKKVLKKLIAGGLLLGAAFFSTTLVSCGDGMPKGMGQAVDTEAPVLKITSPTHFAYVSPTFTVTGTVKDNAKVESVEVKYKYTINTGKTNEATGEKIFQTIQGSKNAIINGESWSCEITAKADAEVSISAFAWDSVRNEGVDYSASVDVVVDTENPKINNVFVKKNGEYQVNLSTRASLEKKVREGPESSSNKDYFQNEVFSIVATINENFTLKESYLSLYDEDERGRVTCLIEKQYPDGNDKTTASPEWTIKKADLEEAASKKSLDYSTGVHYLFSKITAIDEATNVGIRAIVAEPILVYYEYETTSFAEGEATEEVGKYICWWPESDAPKAGYPLASGDGITAQANQTIPVDLFDDDGLTIVYYGLIDASMKTAIGSTKESFDAWLTENKSNTSKFKYVDMSKAEAEETKNAQPGIIYALDYASDESEKKSDAPMTRDSKISELKSGENAQTYDLLILIEDRKTSEKLSGAEKNHKLEFTKVYVDSKNIPLIIVSDPMENTSAALTNVDDATSQFTINGFTLDDDNVEKMAIAWLPLGNEQVDDAVNTYLPTFIEDNNVLPPDTTGIKIWEMTTTAQGSPDSEFGKYKNAFSQSFNVLDGGDFMYNGELQNDNKLFVIYVVDKTGNPQSKTFRLGAYTADPTIKVQYQSDSEWIDFNAALIQMDSIGKVSFKAKPEGANGLGIKTFKVKANGADLSSSSITGPDGDGYYTFNASGTDRLDLDFEVVDKLNNTVSQKNTIISGNKPELRNISTGVRNGITLVKGEVLKIQANFTLSVTVTPAATEANKPYIVLSNILINGLTPDPPQKAIYASGSGSDTLIFEYIVPAEATSEQVETPKTTSPISNASLIQGTTNTSDGKSISEASVYRKTGTIVKIDAVSPKVVSTTLATDQKTVTVEFSEEIFPESGTVTVQRAAGWAIPPVLDEETFKAIYNSRSDADKKKLIGTSTGEPELIENAGTPKGPYKKITHGIKFEGGKAVPDTSTKYVLAFDYDDEELNIFETGAGKIVTGLRKILEDYGYHKTEVDISECSTDGKNLIIPIPDGWFVKGRQFEVVMDEGCVRDDAGNTNAEIERGNSKTTFWTSGVATPVIRVDRYTHGAGFKEPNADAVLGNKIVYLDDMDSPATGYVRVRIDCETPGAAITYNYITKESTTNVSTLTNIGDGKTNNVRLDDATKTEVEGITTTTPYSKIFAVGNNDFEKSHKYYFKAVATKDSAKSDVSYEGAYRTVFLNRSPSRAPSTSQPIYLQGSCSSGEPLIAGFPMRDANSDMRYSRCMWHKQGTNDYIVVSFDIVSTFRTQTFIGNWSKNEDTADNCSYGWVIYNNDRQYW